MRNSLNPFVFAGLILLAFLLARGGISGRDAPDFTLRGAYGGSIYKDSFRGRPVMLVFWTTSCSICRHELPIVDRVATEFRPRGVEVVAVNLGDIEGARAFLREFRLTNAIDETGAAARSFRVHGVPKLVLIDAAGKVKHESSGFQREAVLRNWLGRVAAR